MNNIELTDKENLIEKETAASSTRSDAMEIQVKNPQISKVLALKEEAQRQKQSEQERAKRIQIEMNYLNDMLLTVNDDLTYSKEEQNINSELEHRIQEEVYQMHGISNDKVQGMEERTNALYQGAAFSLLFLSSIMVILCGILHGFDSQICLFMTFYTALEASLLSHRSWKSEILEAFIRLIYLVLFPIMMVVFVCFELGFSQYEQLLPLLIIAGMIILLLGVSSYFLYDPYKQDRKNRKKADRYITEMEKTALKDIQLREAAYKKQERKKEREQHLEKKKAERKNTLKNLQNRLPHRHKEVEIEEKTDTEMPDTEILAISKSEQINVKKQDDRKLNSKNDPLRTSALSK